MSLIRIATNNLNNRLNLDNHMEGYLLYQATKLTRSKFVFNYQLFKLVKQLGY